MRDIIVGYVKAPNVHFTQPSYDAVVNKPIRPYIANSYGAGNHSCDDSNIAEYNGAKVYPKAKGSTKIRSMYPASENYAEVSCQADLHVRDELLFNTDLEKNKILFTEGGGGQPRSIYDMVHLRMASGDPFDKNNSEFKVKSNNPQILNVPDKNTGDIVFGDKSGSVSISLEQGQTNDYTNSSFTRTVTVLRGNQTTNTMYIRNLDEWKLFAHLVNEEKMSNLNAKLQADINLGKEIVKVGINGIVNYSGTLDGQGHTISFDWNSTESFAAPFDIMSGATIKNLHIKGQIANNVKWASGLVVSVVGPATTTISNCVSEVDFKNSSNDDCVVSGFVNVLRNATLVINDCIYKGKIISANNEKVETLNAFVSVMESKPKYTLNNCLSIGETVTPFNACIFSGEENVNNCYYFSPNLFKNGTKITAEQLKSGEVAYKLQAGRSNRVWGQNLGPDDTPWLTDLVERHVNKVDFTYNGNVMLTRYANTGKGVYGGMPTFTAKDLVGNKHNPHHYYKMGLEGGFSASTPVNADRTVAINLAEKDYYEIASKDNWKEFRYIVGNGQNAVDAKMTADVDLGSDIFMVGNSYAGTFDGQNHTLKINWNGGSDSDIAPFYTVDGVTIKNLRTEGEIKSSSHFLSGLVGNAYGTTTISGCVSAVNITSSYDKGGCDAAGMIECVRDNAKVTITDCLVKGKFTATTEKGKRFMSGFVNNQYGTCTLTNCLYIGTNNASGDRHTFAYNATLNNCYYLNLCGKAQGTQVTKEQLKSGEVTYLLQNKRPENIWGQLLGTNDEPQLTADDAKKVCKVDFTYKGQLKATRYATKGKAIFGDMPTVTPQFLLGSDYNSHHYYRYGFSEYFTASTPVNADRTVGLFIEDRDYYEIASKDDWRRFCDLVRDGQNGIDAKMKVDVDLGSDITMAGVDGKDYAGTFDGQGHTLTLNWDAGSDNWKSPFYTVKDGSIKNLRVNGQIKSKGKGHTGLIQNAYGTVTVSDCVSDVNITSNYEGDGCSAAGMIQWVGSNTKVTFNDCLVKGSIDATTDNGKKGMGGFIDNQNGTCTLNNCLYLGTNNATGGYTFAKNATLTNCYYLNTCGTAQGTQATLAQLKNGEITKLLQADRNDVCHWAQVLGEMPDLYRYKDGANYVYYDTANSRWACKYFRLTDGAPLPIGIDFIASYVGYERKLSSKYTATVCLPYEMPIREGFEVYTLSGGQGSNVYFKKVDDKLEAYHPYYLMTSGWEPLRLNGHNLQVKAYKADALKQTTTTGHNFVGTVDGVSNATAAAANAYVLQPDGLFHKVTTENSGATVPAYRAYVVCPKTLGAKQLSVILDGETTGIDGVKNGTRGIDGPVYDLQGRRVADRLDDAARHQLPAGVYIVGGRKVIVK